ncbi:MAG: hypothetical protein KC776_31670 [Myxococcales bacterium]|nr:hypothetical protein [Myxococcales bacterium]MCB9579457.1 hypothetical protein [Polyangiaceae bacterium]
MLVVFLFILAGVAVALYLALMLREVPGFAEQRLGKLEELPPELGKWREDAESEEAARAKAEGLRREVRYTYDDAPSLLAPAGRLTIQVRYRDRETNAIVRAEPDQVEKRRRVKAAG